MKRSMANKTVLFGCAAACLGMAAAGSFLLIGGGMSARAEDGTAATATTVEFDGVGTTGVYSLEHYAGFEGTYWILDTAASTVTEGTAGRRLGSSASDNRDVTITLSVDSAIATTAQLRLWAEFYDANSAASSIQVNGKFIDASGTVQDAATEVNFFAINGVENVWLPTAIPVTLNEGVNTIVLDMKASYNAWMEGFEIVKSNAVLSSDGVAVQIRPQDALSYAGSPTINSTSWGKETADAPASAEYSVYAQEAGYYTFTLGVEAGNENANKGYLKAGDGEAQSLAFDTSLGWGNVSTNNTVTVYLQQGENTIEIGQDVTGGSANWWLKSLSVAYRTVCGITVDTSGAKLQYNPWDTVDTSGIKVSYYDTEDPSNNKTLENSDVKFTLPKLSEKKKDYTVQVSYTNEDAFVCHAQYTVSTVENILPVESDTFRFDGESTGLLPLIGEDGHVGFSTTGNGIAWMSDRMSDPIRYKLGSGASDDRQLTMTFLIDATEAGRAIFTLYGETYAQATSQATVTVNNTQIFNGDLYSVAVAGAMAFDVELNEGENTVVIATQDHYDLWLNGFAVDPAPEATLEVDTSNAQLNYVPYETLDLSGLTATYRYNETVIELDYDDLTIDTSLVDMTEKAEYTVTVSYTYEGIEAQKTIAVTVSGEGKAREAQTIAYDGTETGRLPFFSQDAKVGMAPNGETQQMYWIHGKLEEDIYGDGFVVGNSADTKRAVTFTWKLDSSVAGEVTFSIFGEVYASTNAAILIVNGSQKVIDPYQLMTDGELALQIALHEGENEISLVFGDNYDAWLHGYSFGAVQSDPVDPGDSADPDGSDDSAGSDDSTDTEGPEKSNEPNILGWLIPVIVVAVLVVAGGVVAIVVVKKRKK